VTNADASKEYATLTDVLPEGHVGIGANDHGLLTFAVSNGQVHIHLFRPNGDLDCLAIGTPDHTKEWIRRLYALRNVAIEQRDDTDGGDDP